MSGSPKASLKPELAAWFWSLIGGYRAEGEVFCLSGEEFVVVRGIPRAKAAYSQAQTQTEQAFGFKWNQRSSFESKTSRARMQDWLNERYGQVSEEGWFNGVSRPIVLDAGCGAALSALEYFGGVFHCIQYLGVDISAAVEVARQRIAERGFSGGFMQADIGNLPLPPRSVDIIFSEGALHHTDSTERSFFALAELLKPGGLFMFYVYRKKGPIREFTDDLIREKLAEMPPADAWHAMEPLTRLGVELGRLNVEIELSQPIELLGIPAGKINLQRLFYWHVAKAFYRPDMSFEETNHINFDWYAPRNAHRHTEDQVRTWCDQANLQIERERVEAAGITVVARRRAG